MLKLLRHSLWIYVLLVALVIYWALEAHKKIIPAEQACAQYYPQQQIDDPNTEMEKLAEQGAMVKIQVGNNENGPYPMIEIFEKGTSQVRCRLHIENQKIILIDRNF